MFSSKEARASLALGALAECAGAAGARALDATPCADLWAPCVQALEKSLPAGAVGAWLPRDVAALEASVLGADAGALAGELKGEL